MFAIRQILKRTFFHAERGAYWFGPTFMRAEALEHGGGFRGICEAAALDWEGIYIVMHSSIDIECIHTFSTG